MFRKEVNAYPLCVWLLCAMFALLTRYAASCQWLVVLTAGVGCGLLSWCSLVLREGQVCQKKWYCAVQFLFLVVVTAVSADWSGEIWPTGADDPVIPLVLLLIAMFSAWHGAERAGRAGAVVFWFVALLFAIVVTAGTQNVKPQYLIPKWEGNSDPLFLVFLLPVITSFLPREGAECYTKTLLTAVLLGLLICVMSVGALSVPVAQEESFAFYTFSKSLSLLGIAERFEALVSVAITMGQYCLLSLLLSCAGHLAETISSGQGRTGVIVCTVSAAAFMVFAKEIPDDLLGAAALFVWGVLPLLTRNTTKVKKSKKFEKSA